MSRASWLLILSFIAAIVASRPARACATAPPQGAVVTVADESAVIVWDEATKTEHFVRRATFRTDVQDFGFLVPTPSKPELNEASDGTFTSLESAILPEVVQNHDLRFEVGSFFFMSLARSSKSEAITAAAQAPAVRVLEEKRVGGYDAVVLEADDAVALEHWLKEHGYAQRPALAEWLTPYVEKKWKLTAFKVAAGAGAEHTQPLGTTAVRMSFHTERPFFPYREPRDQRESVSPSASGRSLRVFFVGPKRVGATIGAGATKFLGRTAWAGALDPAKAALPVPAPPGAWLTVFQDDASPRPGTDELWFDTEKDQAPIKPPPIVINVGTAITIPLDLLAVAGVIAALIVVSIRKRRRGRLAGDG